MNDTINTFFGVESSQVLAEKAGIRPGDADPFECMSRAITSREIGEICQTELLMTAFIAGMLLVMNEGVEGDDRTDFMSVNT